MQKNLYFASFFGLLLAPIAHAELRPIAAVSFGFDQVYIGKQQNVLLVPPFINNVYAPDHDFSTQAFGGGFFGVETGLVKDWALQVGLSYYQAQAFNVSGQIYQFGDPSLNDISYQYKIQNKRLLAETKLLYTFQKRFHPYISGGLGEAFNRSYGYQETSASSFTSTMTPFTSSTTHSFTYDLGTGVDVDLTSRVRLGAGYRYADLGKATLGVSPDQSSTETPGYQHLHTNEFILQLSTFFS